MGDLHRTHARAARTGHAVVVCDVVGLGEALIRGLNLRRARVVPLNGPFVVGTTSEHADPGIAVLIELDEVAAQGSIQAARQRWPSTRVLVIGVANHADAVLRCLNAGAHGVITCPEPLSEIQRAVGEILAGRVRIPPRLTPLLLDRLVARGGTLQPLQRGAVGGLSVREIQILLRMAQSKTNKEIASDLFLELQTVKNHVCHILRKLSVRNRLDAVRAGRSYLETWERAGAGSHDAPQT